MMIVQPGRFATAPAADPYFAFVKLLIQPKSSDTSVIDYSPSPHAVTAVGNAALGASSPWAGYQGITLDGSGDYLSIPDSADWSLPGAYVIEAVINVTNFGSERPISGHLPDTGFANAHSFGVGTDGKPFFSHNYADASGSAYDVASSTAIATATQVHVAVAKAAGDSILRMYVAGNLVGSVPAPNAMYDAAAPLLIGQRYVAQTSSMLGSIAAYRLTKGTDRGYVGSTIPNAVTAGPYPTT